MVCAFPFNEAAAPFAAALSSEAATTISLAFDALAFAKILIPDLQKLGPLKSA